MLAAALSQRGHHITVLTRGPFAAPWRTVHWDGLNPGPWVDEIDGTDVVINLAGRSVNCRYTNRHRCEIYDSRVVTTRLLGEAIACLAHPPRLWLNASTATIYRHTLDRAMDEVTGEIGGGEADANSTWDFSVRVARDWEAAFFESVAPFTRKVALRSAITLSPEPGNAFAILSNLVRLGLGGTQGSGRQFVSWIHELDFARAVEFLIHRDDIDGPVNLASPNPVPNRSFMRSLREAWNRPNGVPAPRPILELASWLLRTESELVLKSRRVIPGRLLTAGFRFLHAEWPEAAEDLVREWRARDR
jgi:uncharacterized protein (TIGR01777 family)